MADLFDYLEWRGDISLDEVSFNKIDALLLAHVSYNTFDNLLSSDFNHPLTLNELLNKYRNSPDYEDRKYLGAMLNPRSSELFEKTAESLRFSNLKICGYKAVIDLEKEEQFSAMIFIHGKDNFLVFRGTDDTIVGWREDFNISFLDQIPSQKDGLEYFESAAKTLKGNFTIIGHSKGGNLAMNTAVKCLPKLQKRIADVYNFDGPGFTADFYKQKDYLNVENCIHSFYPGFSIVGMIFQHPQKFEIVKCDGIALYQHDPLMWQIKGGSFENESTFTSESRFFYSTFNSWVNKIEQSQREKLVNTFFGVIEASGARTNTDLVNNKIKASAKMLEAWTKLNREDKSEVHKIVRVLRQAVKSDLPILSIINIQK